MNPRTDAPPAATAVRRFGRAERWVHRTTAVLMGVCVFTAACLYVPQLAQLVGRRALVVTFTRAATAELVTRIRRTLRQATAAFQERADPDEAPAAVRPLLDRWGQTPADRARSRARLVAALGFTANLGPLMEWGIEIKKRQIVVDSMGRTTVPGIYAAGDIVDYDGKVKLIATGFGEVATAVNNAAA